MQSLQAWQLTRTYTVLVAQQFPLFFFLHNHIFGHQFLASIIKLFLSIRMVRKNLKRIRIIFDLLQINKQIYRQLVFHSPLQPIKFQPIKYNQHMEHHESSHYPTEQRQSSFKKIKYVSQASEYQPQDQENLDRHLENRSSRKRQSIKNSAIEDFGHAESKGRKINIKKLIQLKEARENKDKNQQVKLAPQYTKYFQRKEHPGITACIVCGFIVFTSDEGRRKKQCIGHLEKLHSFLPNIHESYPQADCNSDQEYENMATKLLKFANSEQNGELMQFVIGQKHVQPFKPYVEHLKVEQNIQRWTKSVEKAFNFYDF